VEPRIFTKKGWGDCQLGLLLLLPFRVRDQVHVRKRFGGCQRENKKFSRRAVWKTSRPRPKAGCRGKKNKEKKEKASVQKGNTHEMRANTNLPLGREKRGWGGANMKRTHEFKGPTGRIIFQTAALKCASKRVLNRTFRVLRFGKRITKAGKKIAFRKFQRKTGQEGESTSNTHSKVAKEEPTPKSLLNGGGRPPPRIR